MTFRVSRNVAAMVMALMTFNAGFAKFKWIWATGTIAGYLSRTVLIE
jgi:hypothetical protein